MDRQTLRLRQSVADVHRALKCTRRRPFCAFVARHNLYYYYVPFQSVRRRTYYTVNTMKTVLLYVCAALAVAASGVWSLSVYTDDDRARVPQPLADVAFDHGSSAYLARSKRESPSTSPSILPGVSDGNITSKVSGCRHCYRCPTPSWLWRLSGVIENIHSTATHSSNKGQDSFKKIDLPR